MASPVILRKLHYDQDKVCRKERQARHQEIHEHSCQFSRGNSNAVISREAQASLKCKRCSGKIKNKPKNTKLKQEANALGFSFHVSQCFIDVPVCLCEFRCTACLQLPRDPCRWQHRQPGAAERKVRGSHHHICWLRELTMRFLQWEKDVCFFK